MTPYTLPPDVIPAETSLIGVDGNAFAIMSAVRRGLRKAGNPKEIIDAYSDEATSGDYDHMLMVSMAYCADGGM